MVVVVVKAIVPATKAITVFVVVAAAVISFNMEQFNNQQHGEKCFTHRFHVIHASNDIKVTLKLLHPVKTTK